MSVIDIWRVKDTKTYHGPRDLKTNRQPYRQTYWKTAGYSKPSYKPAPLGLGSSKPLFVVLIFYSVSQLNLYLLCRFIFLLTYDNFRRLAFLCLFKEHCWKLVVFSLTFCYCLLQSLNKFAINLLVDSVRILWIFQSLIWKEWNKYMAR